MKTESLVWVTIYLYKWYCIDTMAIVEEKSVACTSQEVLMSHKSQ